MFKIYHIPYLRFFCYLLLLVLVSCKSLGPNSIHSNRGSYIEALSQTDKEEMLANIVRAKHNDPPVFLKINSISAAPSLEVGSENHLNLGLEQNFAYVQPTFIYRESPTILYTPIMGMEYSTQLLMPMGLMNLFLMFNNGFDLDLIADLMLISINGKTNSRTASESDRTAFKNLTRAMNNLYKQKLIKFATTKNPDHTTEPNFVIDIRKEALETDDYKYMAKELGIEANATTIDMKLGFSDNDKVFAVNTRSFLALINYLANYVDVPEQQKKMVRESNINVNSGNIHVYCSNKMPQNANTAVFIYHTWYYIKSDDLSSQHILYLMQILFNLQAHIGNSNGNIQYTLPLR